IRGDAPGDGDTRALSVPRKRPDPRGSGVAMELDARVIAQIFGAARQRAAPEIARARADDVVPRTEPPPDEGAVHDTAGAERDVEPLGHDVDDPVGGDHVDLQLARAREQAE